MRKVTLWIGLVVAAFTTVSLRAQGSIVPGPNDVVVEDFNIQLRISVELPGRIGGLGDFFESEIEFLLVAFREGNVDYGGVSLDLDEVEFDLVLTRVCAQLALAGEIGIIGGQVCLAGPEQHVAGELLSLDLAEDYLPQSSFSWVPDSRATLALELPAWAEEPSPFANRRVLLIGEAIVTYVQARSGIVELDWTGEVWMVRVYRRGDSNDDGTVNISDPIFTLQNLFLNQVQTLECMDAADADGDGEVMLTDAVYELHYLFLNGPPLAVPGAEDCGPPIPSFERPIDCERFTSCF